MITTEGKEGTENAALGRAERISPRLRVSAVSFAFVFVISFSITFSFPLRPWRILCALCVHRFRLAFAGYKKLRHPKAAIAARPKHAQTRKKPASQQRNKIFGNFFRRAKNRAQKHIFDFHYETLFARGVFCRMHPIKKPVITGIFMFLYRLIQKMNAQNATAGHHHGARASSPPASR